VLRSLSTAPAEDKRLAAPVSGADRDVSLS
jgi:hypothetical protein